jgi:hypothetical protein
MGMHFLGKRMHTYSSPIHICLEFLQISEYLKPFSEKYILPPLFLGQIAFMPAQK